MAERGTGPTLCFALCEFVDGRPYFSSCKLYGCIFRALPLMAKGISSRHFIAVPLSHARELSMEDPCCKLPELGIHHCVLLFFPLQIPLWVICCADTVCSLAVQTRRETGVAPHSRFIWLFGSCVKGLSAWA